MFSTIKPDLYIQISPERIMLKNLKTGELISSRAAPSAPPAMPAAGARPRRR